MPADRVALALGVLIGSATGLTCDDLIAQRQDASALHPPLGVDDAPEAQRHPFLRYDWTPANAVALLEGACLTPARARRRFDQGRADAATFLELSGLPGRAS